MIPKFYLFIFFKLITVQSKKSFNIILKRNIFVSVSYIFIKEFNWKVVDPFADGKWVSWSSIGESVPVSYIFQ